MLMVLILFKDKNITIEDEIDKESEIKQENVVAEHLAANLPLMQFQNGER